MRESSRESVFGLAGWLFADLLLALSVVFLVAQDRPQVGSTVTISVDEYNRLLEAEKRLQELLKICTETKCGAASGLSPGEQLVVTVPQGASDGVNVDQMVEFLKSSKPEIEEKIGETKPRTPTSWDQLKEDNTRIGFVILYTRFDETTQEQAEDNLGVIVEAFYRLGLVNPSLQNIPESSGDYRFENFPSLTRMGDTTVNGTSLKIRAFLFKDGPVSGTTTTTVED